MNQVCGRGNPARRIWLCVPLCQAGTIYNRLFPSLCEWCISFRLSVFGIFMLMWILQVHLLKLDLLLFICYMSFELSDQPKELRKEEGKLFFLLYSFRWPGWDLLGHPTHSGACRWYPGNTGTPREIRRSQQRVSSLRSLSVVPGWERKAKLHIVPSFLNSDWQEKIFSIDFFLPRTAIAFLFVSFCVLRIWTGQGKESEKVLHWAEWSPYSVIVWEHVGRTWPQHFCYSRSSWHSSWVLSANCTPHS